MDFLKKELGFFLKLRNSTTTPSSAKTNISHVCVNIYIRRTTHFLHQHPRTREEPSLYKLSKSKDIDFLCVHYKPSADIHRDILTSVMTFVKYG